jgi:hypothetical protein
MDKFLKNYFIFTLKLYKDLKFQNSTKLLLQGL